MIKFRMRGAPLSFGSCAHMAMVLIAKHDAPVDAGWRCREGETMIGSLQPLVGPPAREAHAVAPFVVDRAADSRAVTTRCFCRFSETESGARDAATAASKRP